MSPAKIARVMQLCLLVTLATAVSVSAQMPPVRVACIGNSITIGYGLHNPDNAYPQQLGRLLGKRYDVRNFGVGGRTMLKKGDYPYWKEKFYKEALAFKPQIVTICLGTNDSKPWNWKYKADFFDDYMDMIKSFRDVNPHVQIFVCLPPPVFHSRFGITDSIVHGQVIPIIKAVRISAGTALIDFYDNMRNDGADFFDGVHPDSTGDSIMAQIVYLAIGKSPSGIIRNFSANRYVTGPGKPATLYWTTTKGSEASINGKRTNGIDSMTVNPAKTTVYTLTTAGEVRDTCAVRIRNTGK